MVLPDETRIQSIDVTAENYTRRYTDSIWMKACILKLAEAQATTKASIQDMPLVDAYIKLEIVTEDDVTTLYVYLEQDQYYIEQPYQGIYKTDAAFYEMLVGEKDTFIDGLAASHTYVESVL